MAETNIFMKIEYDEFKKFKKISFADKAYSDEYIPINLKELSYFVFECGKTLEEIDLTNINFDDDTLKWIFKGALTANIHINKDSSFNQWLSQEANLSEKCKKYRYIQCY